MQPYAFAGGRALVTGAASGIGEALARGLAARGSHLVLLDRHTERLAAVATDLRSAYPELVITTVLADLADHEATVAMAARLAADHPDLTLLINNAGVALAGTFEQLTAEEFDWLLEINFRAVVTLCHHLVPVLARQPGSHLVNLSSVFGLAAPATQTAYGASKFAVRGFTEALRGELAGRVGVTCVHPGGVATRIASEARISVGADREAMRSAIARLEPLLSVPPDRAADLILAGVHRRRARVLIGASAWWPDLLVRVSPTGYPRLLSAITRWSARLRPRPGAQPSTGGGAP